MRAGQGACRAQQTLRQRHYYPQSGKPGRLRCRACGAGLSHKERIMSLQGKVALVTGASRGIGQAIAFELGRQGAVVIGTATSEGGAARIGEALREQGIQGAGLVLDVASSESVDAVLEQI